MRVRRALGAVMAVLGAAAMGACYSVPDVVDGGATPGSRDGGDGEHEGEAESGGGPGVDASDGSTGGHDSGPTGDADAGGGCGVLSTCKNNQDCCAKTFCAVEGVVPAGVISANQGNAFCTQPCCSSVECPAGTVCFAPGEGGQYCVNPAWIGRANPGASPKVGGTPCSTNSDCRSGLCGNGTCQDTCCSQHQSIESCAEPMACVFGAFPGSSSLDTHFAPHCGPAPGSGAQDQPCSTDSDCQSGYCGIDYTGMKGCEAPCRNTNDCSIGGDICDYGQHGSDLVASCLPSVGGTGQEGASCDPSSMAPQCVAECGPMNACTGVCFGNGDCTYAGWACEPQSVQFGVGSGAPSYDILICGTP